MSYKILRWFANDWQATQTIYTGLTLEEAQAHCGDPETSSRTCQSEEGKRRTAERGPWFDGYTIELVAFFALIAALLIAAPAQAGERKRNHIIRRQQAYQVRSVPVARVYSHGRKIDVYRDGSAFEKDGRAN